jgi:organic hydroperoxide reductase OsmC/OhrA
VTLEMPHSLTTHAKLSRAAASASGPGDETSREAGVAELFVDAIGACYAATLGGILDTRRLPWAALEIETAMTTALAQGLCYVDTITIRPAILGGDSEEQAQYGHAARQARDHSLACRAMRGNVAFKIEELTIVTSGGARTERNGPAGRPDRPEQSR